jgi:hypothetical protein
MSRRLGLHHIQELAALFRHIGSYSSKHSARDMFGMAA